jgi:hypothetical protein
VKCVAIDHFEIESPIGSEDRQARHLLESIERKGYIRRFPKRRSHANYPIDFAGIRLNESN